jgi:osmotically-inducible protein OsmY
MLGNPGRGILRWTWAAAYFASVLALLLAWGAAPAQEITDMDIARAVEDEFWLDDAVNANAVDVSVREGVVTLTGTVGNILSKDRATEIAESTVGVRAIVNRLEVRPAIDRNDSELEQAVREALRKDPAADSYELDVSVRNGEVTLGGTVQSWQENWLSETVAKGVRGVREVRNDIRVNYKTDRSDAEIKADVEGRLENDVRVDDYLISVEVDDGKVKLLGDVGSLAEKNRARNDAWVAGTTDVDASGLEVKWWARDTMRRSSSYVGRSDEEIERAVQDAFLYDPRVMAFEPTVSVENGTVTLAGIVDNLAAKEAAEQDARNTVGVWRVRNHLKVRPVGEMSDADIEAQVGDAFYQDPYLERWEIDIDSNLGLVTLSGTVNTSFEKRQAEDVAEGVAGVIGVVNKLEYEHEWEWKPDWEIRADIEDELWWSTFVDSDDINVEVEDGVATLTGEVDTWSERNAAEKNAFDGGAKDVENQLKVTYQYYGPYPAYGSALYMYDY